jgi:hypothetical protein
LSETENEQGEDLTAEEREEQAQQGRMQQTEQEEGEGPEAA